MKTTFAAILFGAALAVSGTANAGADDAKWVTQCMQDNASANVAQEVVSTYCTCMNNKMSEDETQSISQWEKSHPNETAACEKQAGWK